MPGIRLITSLLVLGLTTGVAAHPAVQDPPSRSAPLIEIDAVAVDRDGRPVLDITADDLEVWIGGYRVPIESLEIVTPESADAGRIIVLLLDDVTLDPTMVGRARSVANHFVNGMRPGDRMAVATFSGGSTPLTANAAELRARIESLRMSLGVMTVDRLGEHLLRVVESMAQSIVETPGKRKTIVGIGSGWLFNTPIPPAQFGARDLRREWDDAIRALAVADAALYVIDPRGVGATRVVAGDGFARETGGHAFVNTNDLEGAADRILAEASHYYVVRVEDPPVGRKARLREVAVKSKREGVTVRARRAIPGGA